MATDTSDVAVAVSAPKNARKDALQKEYDARGYKPVFLGNSAEDVVYITVALLLLWGFTTGYFVALLHGALETDDTSTALWIYFGVFGIGFGFLALVLCTSEYERTLKGDDKEK